MVSLLKHKAKIGIVQRQRKTYEVADVFPKHRDDQGIITNVIPPSHQVPDGQKQTIGTKKVVPKLIEKYDE